MNYLNDTYLTYNLNAHRYEVNPEGFNQVYGINIYDELGANNNANAYVNGFLYRASLVLYNYIYEYSKNKDEREYTMSLPKHRQAIQEALYELVFSWLINHYDPSVMMDSDWEKMIPLSARNIVETDGLLTTSSIYFDDEMAATKGVDY